MRAARILALSALMAALSACSTYSLAELRATPPKGTPYQAALATRYLAYAEDEAKNYDWIDSGYFADKGLIAAYGKDVGPEELSNWSIPSPLLPEFEAARAELVGLLTPERTEAKPEEAASAVYYFDCWVENQDEGWQPSEIEICHDGFKEAMKALAEEPKPEAVAADAEAAKKEAYIVFFGMNKAELDEHGQKAVGLVAEDIKKEGEDYTVVVNGHTDTTGSARYNMELSKKRADSVAEALAAAGISKEAIRAFGFGETDPKVKTKDGVPEPKNRRVEIYIGDK